MNASQIATGQHFLQITCKGQIVARCRKADAGSILNQPGQRKLLHCQMTDNGKPVTHPVLTITTDAGTYRVMRLKNFDNAFTPFIR